MSAWIKNARKERSVDDHDTKNLVLLGTVVALLPAATDTRWFEHVWQWAHEIRFLTPRVRFLRPDGSPGTSNTTGSLIAIYRPGVLWQYGEAVGPVITYAPRVMHVRWIGNVPTEKPQQLSLEEPS